jgi:hypothetical protein
MLSIERIRELLLNHQEDHDVASALITELQQRPEPEAASLVEEFRPRNKIGLLSEAPDPIQTRIITAPVNSRQLVMAPPGTGKTHIAMRRIQHLLETGIPASQIWMISFTRTAVAELRKRLAMVTTQDATAAHVVVATVNSQGWHLLNGFADTMVDTVGYDSTLDRCLALLRSPTAELRDRLQEICCLIVDEAQDLNGNRADFVVSLMTLLRNDAGLTILGDEAQAIYDFAERAPGGSLLSRIAWERGYPIEKYELSHVHRTSSSRLSRLFISARAQMLSSGSNEALDGIRTSIREAADRIWGDPFATHLEPDELVLHRFRYDALRHFGRYAKPGRPAQLRLPGLPDAIHPWVGLIFSELTGDRIREEDFMNAWARRFSTNLSGLPDASGAWDTLLDIGSTGSRGRVISRSSVREALTSGYIPTTMRLREYGFEGPTFGTIHSSKGREARSVRVALPDRSIGVRDASEEARVLFVGATRASNRLTVSEGTTPFVRYHNDRPFVVEHSGSSGRHGARPMTGVSVELGRSGDVDEWSVVSDASGISPVRVQSLLAKLWNQCIEFDVNLTGGEWILREFSTGNPTALISDAVADDLCAIANRAFKRFSGTPVAAHGILSIGARTVVAGRAEAIERGVLDRFADSGFWLAPMIAGLAQMSVAVGDRLSSDNFDDPLAGR